MYFNATDEKIEKIAQTSGIFAENNLRTGIYLKSASVGRLKLRVAVGASEDDLLSLDRVAYVEGPFFRAAQGRNIPGHFDDFRGGVLRYGKQLGKTCRRGSYTKQREDHAVGTTQPHKVNENPGRFHTKVLCGLPLPLVF